MRLARSASGVPSSLTSSIATIAPRPRTSPMPSARRCIVRSRSSMRSPSFCARSTSPSVSITSIAASAAAHDTGLPPNVLPSPPTCTASMISARPVTPADRHAAAQPFRGRDQVGHHAFVLAREPRARAPETGLHFVGDEDHAVRRAPLGDAARTSPARARRSRLHPRSVRRHARDSAGSTLRLDPRDRLRERPPCRGTDTRTAPGRSRARTDRTTSCTDSPSRSTTA